MIYLYTILKSVRSDSFKELITAIFLNNIFNNNKTQVLLNSRMPTI